jgi:hypothetical protein
MMESAMSALKLEDLDFSLEDVAEEEDFEIPLDIEDVISICREYNKLGWQLQNQTEAILNMGVEEALTSGYVKKEALPHVKEFLQQVITSISVGGAVSQASDCIDIINQYLAKHKTISQLN